MTSERKQDCGLSTADAEHYRKLAKDQHHEDGVIEVDDDAPISCTLPPEDGVYVQAWVWVYDD